MEVVQMMKLQSIYEIRHRMHCKDVYGGATFDLGTKVINNIKKDIKVEMDHLVEKATKFIKNIVEAYGKPMSIHCWYDISGTNVTFWVIVTYPNVEDWVFEWTTSWFDTE
jgi:hypothetical protein